MNAVLTNDMLFKANILPTRCDNVIHAAKVQVSNKNFRKKCNKCGMPVTTNITNEVGTGSWV